MTSLKRRAAMLIFLLLNFILMGFLVSDERLGHLDIGWFWNTTVDVVSHLDIELIFLFIHLATGLGCSRLHSPIAV